MTSSAVSFVAASSARCPKSMISCRSGHRVTRKRRHYHSRNSAIEHQRRSLPLLLCPAVAPRQDQQVAFQSRLCVLRNAIHRFCVSTRARSRAAPAQSQRPHMIAIHVGKVSHRHVNGTIRWYRQGCRLFESISRDDVEPNAQLRDTPNFCKRQPDSVPGRAHCAVVATTRLRIFGYIRLIVFSGKPGRL